MPTSLNEVDFIKTFVATLICATTGGALAGGVANAVADSMGAPRELVASSLVAASSMLIGYLAFRIFVRIFIIQKIVGTSAR
jgi:hypothetical protein